MYNQDSIALTRDCEAVLVPMADRVLIPKGTEVIIAQELGGSYTVYVNGNLARIAGKDADALGREPVSLPKLPEGSSEEEIEALVWEQMKTCFDPEIPINIVDLGLIYECSISSLANGQKEVNIKMTLTAPGCGMGGVLVEDVKEKIEAIPAVENAAVELVFDPPWNQNMMSEAAKLQTGMY
jgi:probable FeS assembly SUF system protein SufT